MIFTRTSIPDVVIIEPLIHGDERGYFVETFRQDKLEAFLGFKVPFCQDNESKSFYGVLRGLHYQLAPHAQSKLVRVISGEVLDVAVDLRVGSTTYGKHVAIKLNGENKRQVFIPRGFAHGFIVLSESCTFSYKVDNFYNQEADRGIMFNDPELGIDWLVDKNKLQLSSKDLKQTPFKLAESFEMPQGLYA